ncbi:MAG: hypothetical protein ITD31_03380 [Nitrosospira sp.]|nr:hypothetical protein [Nitrosospira sp.]
MRTTAQRNSGTAPALIPKKRCAVYTRKSSEEGLEQEYNSLWGRSVILRFYMLIGIAKSKLKMRKRMQPQFN